MQFRSNAFEFGPSELRQYMTPDSVERHGRIDSDRLVMESEIDRRFLMREELPSTGTILSSGFPLLDWAFLIARRDLESNFYPGGVFAGKHFQTTTNTTSWVRDTSYTAMMGMSCFYPEKVEEVMPTLLDDKLQEIQFEQYRAFYEKRCFTMTDHILWVLAAEKHDRLTGGNALLREGLPYAAKTISRILHERLDSRTQLIVGGTSLFDGHSGFPKGMTGPDLRSSSTHLLYLRAMQILSGVQGIDHAVSDQLLELEAQLRTALNDELWIDEKGYYAQLHYGENYREERFETLGNITAIADPNTERWRAEKILQAIKQHPYGLPALFPWYNEEIVYHTEGIWPFMMGFGLFALRERGDELDPALVKASGLDITYIASQLIRTSILEGTFMELVHCRTGQGRYSHSQTWSAAAMLALVEYGLFGMRFEQDTLHFRPSRPDFLSDNDIELRDIVIRGKKVSLTLHADNSVSVNGQRLNGNTLRLSEVGMRVPSLETAAIEFVSPLSLPAKPELATVVTSSEDLSLKLFPTETTVFPAIDQIGSYSYQVTLRNDSDTESSLLFQATSPDPTMTVIPAEFKIAAPPHSSKTGTVRLVFAQPPEDFGGGELRIAAVGANLEHRIPIRRLLTLDMGWRYKQVYRHTSLSYAYDFRNFGSWDILRAPLDAEFRLAPYTGWLWYQKKLVIPSSWQESDLVFYAGAMSACDVTYFNGTEIGSTGAPHEDDASGQERRYAIPSSLVKPGEQNTMAVKVYCHGTNSGICGGPLFISREYEFDWALTTARQLMDANYLEPTERGGNAAH